MARIDNLEFLADVIPKTTTYKQFKERKAREEAAAAQPGQSTLQNGVNGHMGVHAGERPNSRHGPVMNGYEEPLKSSLPAIVNGSPIADRTLPSSSHSHPGTEDVEMRG